MNPNDQPALPPQPFGLVHPGYPYPPKGMWPVMPGQHEQHPSMLPATVQPQAPMHPIEQRKASNRQLYTMEHFEPFAEIASKFAASRLFGDLKPEQIFVVLMKGHELGLAPCDAMDHIYVVKGKTSMAAKKMIALMEEAGIRVEAVEKTDAKAVVKFTKPNGQTHTETFTFEDAKRAGLTGNDRYQKDPKTMLFYRAVSQGARSFCPATIGGMITPDEAAEIQDNGEGTGTKPPAIPSEKGGAPAGSTVRGRKAAHQEPEKKAPASWTDRRKDWFRAKCAELGIGEEECNAWIAKLDVSAEDLHATVIEALKKGDVQAVRAALPADAPEVPKAAE